MKTSHYVIIGISTALLFGCGSSKSGTVASSKNYSSTYPAHFHKRFTQICRSAIAQTGRKIPVKTQQKYCTCTATYIQKNYPYKEYDQHERGVVAGKTADQKWFSRLFEKKIKVCYWT